MSTLIVALPLPGSSAAGVHPYVLSPDGSRVGQHASAPLELLPARGRGAAEVVALVPAAALSWHKVELPKGTLSRGSANSQRLRAVLDGVLEDRLLDDTADLHFALEPDARAGAPVWVAVCDRGWLRAALAALENAGRAATRIVPEFAPGPAGSWAIGTPDDARLVVTGEHGVTLLPLAAASLSVAFHGAPPEDLPTLAEPAVAELAEQTLERPVALQTASERWLEAARARWDLAQFGLASSGRGRAIRKAGGVAREWLSAPRWRAARWGAALLVAVQLIGLNAWAWRENAALAAQRRAIDDTLRETFPGVRVVVDAPLQMERELSLLRQSAGAASGRDFEAIASVLSGALAQVAPQTTPTAIEFANGELRAKGLNLNSAQVAALAERLRGAGLAARTDGDSLLVRPQAVAAAAAP